MMRTMDPARLHRFLADQGYSIDTRADGFVTVLVAKGAERWLGHGGDEAAALANAVGGMFPSCAARGLLEAELSVPAPPQEADRSWGEPFPGATPIDPIDLAGTDEPPSEADPPSQGADEQPTADGSGPFVGTVGDAGAEGLDPTEELAVFAEASVPQEEVPLAPVIGVDPDQEETLAGLGGVAAVEPPAPIESVPASPVRPPGGTVPAASATPATPAAPPPSPPRATLKVWDALSRIVSLNDEIDDLLAEVAWMAPVLVRLQLTAWLARGRAIQEAAGHQREVEGAIRRLAGRLGGVTKRWWPGNVSALQLFTVPAEVSRSLRLGLGARPTWDEVAEAIETRLDEVDEGWADDAALEPRPNSIDSTFERICGNLDALLGPLDREPSHTALAHLADTQTRQAMQEWARRLRWMRGVAPSGERWACALGHLRWVAQHAPATRRYLDAALDPERGPREGTWAKALGEDPRKHRRARQVRAVLRATPHAAADRDAVAAWLAQALALGADLTNRQIIGLVPTHHESILALTNDELGEVERNVRSRLRKLQKALTQGESASPAPALDDDVDEGVVDEDDAADPVGDLVTRVRAEVGGKRAVFVSNRKDPILKAKLEESLGLHIEWCAGSPRRVQSVADQVSGGGYDLVILATGFAGHGSDAILGKAASGVGVPFVRAYKGRPLATLRALARDLGIRQEG